jgi:hypothetical protein
MPGLTFSQGYRRNWAWISVGTRQGDYRIAGVQLDGLLKDLISDQAGGWTLGEELI